MISRFDSFLRPINIFCLILAFSICTALIWYVSKAVPLWHFLEPAENENAFLIWVLQGAGAFPMPSLSEMVEKYGVLPIYPPLFHQIASLLPLPPIVAGRVVSGGVFMIAMGFLYQYARKITGFSGIAAVPALLIGGDSPDFSYFFMCRADGAFIGFGLIGLLLPLYAVDVETSRSQRVVAVSLSGIFTVFAMLCKQTGVVFAATNFLAILYSANRNKSVRDGLTFTITASIVFFGYFLLLNPDLMTEYSLGLKFYGGSFSSDHFRAHLFYLISDYPEIYAVPLCVVVLEGALRILKVPRSSLKMRTKLFAFFMTTLFLLVTTKLWGNVGAFSNNFILVSLLVVFNVLLFWRNLSSLTKFATAIALLVCLSLHFSGQKAGEFVTLTPSMQIHQTESLINRLVANAPGDYLSMRADFFALSNGQKPVLEGSVMVMTTRLESSSLEAWPELQGSVIKFKEELKRKIAARKLRGIILGIQADLLLSVFPEIPEYYQSVQQEVFNNGIFEIKFELLLPREP